MQIAPPHIAFFFFLPITTLVPAPQIDHLIHKITVQAQQNKPCEILSTSSVCIFQENRDTIHIVIYTLPLLLLPPLTYCIQSYISPLCVYYSLAYH